MDSKEIRLRCIEAATGAGIRAVSDVLRDAGTMEVWVKAAEPDKEATPPKRGRKASTTADKEQSPA